MRILFISIMDGFPWGGSEELWYRTALEALNQEKEVMVAVYDWEKEPSQILKLREHGASIVKIPFFSTKIIDKVFRKLFSFFYKKNLNKLIDFNPDIIVLSQGGTNDIIYNKIFLNVLKIINRPYFIICQHNFEVGNILPNDLRAKLRAVFSNAKKVMFVAERNLLVAQRQLTKQFDNSCQVNNPVNISNREIKPFPGQDGGLKLACVARLHCAFKGQDLLLQVLSSELWKSRRYSLNFYGEGPDKDYLLDLIKYYTLEGSVTMCGKSDNIEEVWQNHHILILPSLSEGTPLSMVEAMLSGRAVLSTDVGDVKKYIIDGKTGYLTSPTYNCIFDSMEIMWKNKSRLEEMGKNAFLHATGITDPNPHVTMLKHLTSI